MNYKQLVDYMKLQKYTDDQIKRTIIFLDNQEYYETTKKLNQEIIEEVQKTNEIITENVLEFKKEEVVKIQKEELQETLSNIILDLKPEELKIKFLESNIDRANAYDNIDFLMKVIPETSTKYEALKDVKTELELKPISTISSKQPQDYTLSSYNKELNIDLSKPKENIDINFSKPTQKFDTSSLEPKTITPIDYSSVEVKSKNYLNSYQQNDIPLDLSKPKMVNVEYPKQETIIPTKVEVKSNDIPTTPKVLNNDETFGNYIERTFSNIENKKYTLSGLDELVKDLNTYKEKETNPQKKEIFEVLETSAFSQFVVSVDQYNKDFNKEVTEQIKTKINQNEKEINIQEDIKRYEEEHKNDSKVKDSSIFSFTLIGALLDNLNATYITQEEAQTKQKQHSKMLQEKDQDVKKFEENLEHKKDEEKNKNFKSMGYISALYALDAYKLNTLSISSKAFNLVQDDLYKETINGTLSDEKSDKLNLAQIFSMTSMIDNAISGISGGEAFKNEFKEISNKAKNNKDPHKSAHDFAGDILQLMAHHPLEAQQLMIANPMIFNDIPGLLNQRELNVIEETNKKLQELSDKGYLTQEEEAKKLLYEKNIRDLQKASAEQQKIKEELKNPNLSNEEKIELINKSINIQKPFEAELIQKDFSNLQNSFNSLNNVINNNNKCLIEESDISVNLKNSFKDFNSEKNMIEYPENFGRDM